jgi:hypothetical protein
MWRVIVCDNLCVVWCCLTPKALQDKREARSSKAEGTGSGLSAEHGGEAAFLWSAFPASMSRLPMSCMSTIASLPWLRDARAASAASAAPTAPAALHGYKSARLTHRV